MVEPREGEPSSEATEVRVLADREALYIGVICHDSRPEAIVSYTMQRDGSMAFEDHIRIVFDTFADGRSGYVFAVNPNGARYDALVAREGEGESPEWDGIWEAAARRNSQGWTVEMRIPVRTLRFPAGSDRWGFNIERRIQRLQETDRWASPIRNFRVTHVSRAGRLVGLPKSFQGMGLTLRPYGLSGLTRPEWKAPTSSHMDVGLDFWKNFGSSVTGLLSINTDFAETEVDTRQVNLTRFPLFFPEKRTFFLEGSDIFDFGQGLRVGPFYDLVPFFTRRIGLVEGQPVPLDVAVKVTGRIGDTSFGILDVLTRPVAGLAPRAHLFAARAYQSIWSESKVGFITTVGDPTGVPSSWLAGLDFTYKTSRFRGDKNFLIGVWGLYNHRPDRRGDSTAWGFKVDYPNDLWDVALIFKHIGDAFDPSLGFLPWAGIDKWSLGLQYKPRPGWRWLRQMFYQVFTRVVFDLDGRLMQYRVGTAPLNWLLESGDRFQVNIASEGERLPKPFTIAGQVEVPAGTYHWFRYLVGLETAEKRPWKAKLEREFGTFYGGHLDKWLVDLTWRPSPHWNLSLGAEYDRGRLPTGRFTIRVVRARMGIFITPDLQLTSFVQYDNQTHSIGTNTRLRWTYRSVFDVFLVHNYNWLQVDGGYRSNFNQVLLKIQYAWQP